MVPKVERLAAKLTSIISAWTCVECIVSGEASDLDLLDPYFALILDVYCVSNPPSERQDFFDNPGAFETSWSGKKDRFFLDGIPIRIEYKITQNFDKLIDESLQATWIPTKYGTYPMYRLVNGTILYNKSEWLKNARTSLLAVKSNFWNRLIEAYHRKMEHSLTDLGGAAFKGDSMFYFISLAGFMQASAQAVFATNKQWEPSSRNMPKAILELPLLPDDFPNRWQALLRMDGSLDPVKRYHNAQLIARSIVTSVQ